MIALPRIALVGRPNVGKSTLFNRICGRRQAIIDSRPGSTRDRNYAQASWQGAAFELVDTGGLLLGSDDPLLGPAADQARLAIAEADLVLFLVDARAGLLPDDEEIAAGLRRAGKPVVLAVNKAEGRQGEEALPDFARLGFEEVFEISAEHGQGVGDLLDAACARVAQCPVPEPGDEALRLALVGRPNVGKSSLLNHFLGAERALVSPMPGTTRDAIDGLVTRKGRRYVFVDTAGIRKVRALRDDVDHVAVVQSRRAIEQAQVVLLVLDAAEGIREMDATIGGYAHEAGRPVVITVNKWDLAREKDLKARLFETQIRERFRFLAYAPILRVSARTGHGLARLLEAADRGRESSLQRVTTGELNRQLAEAVARHAPRAARGSRSVKILYAAQVGVAPPTFSLSVRPRVPLHFSYLRYLENRLRESFGFEGTPLVLKTRGGEGRSRGR